jgi:hypothetical protein
MGLMLTPGLAQAQDRFLGTGGGDWLLAAGPLAGIGARKSFEPARCGNALCELDLQIAEAADGDDPQRVLYRSRFAVKATSNLPGCRAAAGVVDGPLIDLGACGRGAFVGPNEVHLRLPGGAVVQWVFDFVPDLHTGAWVATGQPGRVFKFSPPSPQGTSLVARGCELRAGAAPQATELVVTVSNFRQVAGSGGAAVPQLKPRTRIGRLVRANGEVYSGDFVGVSAMQLRSPQGVLRLERRNQRVAC